MEEHMDKREFMRRACFSSAGVICLNDILKAESGSIPGRNAAEIELWKWSKECMYYEVTPRGTKCLVCPNECTLKTGETSTCRNRVNHKDKLYSIAYGNPCALHIDPIEKKPFFHFMPGSRSFSIATAGCNFACLNCQNWSISQSSPKETTNYDLFPARVVEESIAAKCHSIAYTYSEPVTFCEYVYDTSVAARKEGIKNVLVSNGYINERPSDLGIDAAPSI
jgi:pyruvate formate lyase activating enzyme